MARILVIDDEPVVREFVKEVLDLEGHRVETANDGYAGVTAFKRQPADLVIVDLIMPYKDGTQTIEELRQMQPELPLVVMTGAPPARWPIHMLDGHNAEMHILAKPMTQEMLLDTMREALGEEVGS
ncbi:MAG: response regulator [Planctomycetota bacterium]|jgi:DNA-binding response OmpR family regulator